MSDFKPDHLGFTLLELMVAMLLGIIVMAAVFNVFESSNMAYIVQEEVAVVQQDVRVGRTWVERDVRMAGAGLADYPALAGLGTDATVAVTWENNQGVEGSDILTIRYITPEMNLCGDPPASDPSMIPCSSLPPLSTGPKWSGNTSDDSPMPVTSSTAAVSNNLTVAPYDTWDGECYCNDDMVDLTNSSKGDDLEAIIISPDGTQADKILINKSSPHSQDGKSTVNNHPVVDYSNKVANTYPMGSTIQFFDFKPIELVRYYVNDDNVLIREYDDDLTDNGGVANPIAEQIVEHIEDLQFAYGLDLLDGGGAPGQDGVVDTWEDGTGANMNGNDLDPAVKPFLKTIRLSLLGRADREHQDLPPNKRPAIEDHAEAGTADYFHRRLSQVSIQLRNMDL